MKVINIKDDIYPKKLLKITNPPENIYVKGNTELLNNKSLAIVGARKCSEYGITYTKEFAKEIAKNNITIISGLALGIDTVAHDTAKKYIGNTIAVVGCGLNYIYPEENKELFKQIINEGGCIISEYKPDEPIDMKSFPKRNRIISGLSDAILVIEARHRSGSTITGGYGLEQGKKVFCLPRDIGNKMGVGTNELIKKGAKLVTKPAEILQEFGIQNKEIDSSVEQLQIEEDMSIPLEYINIYQLITYNPQNIQYFVKRSGLNVAEVTQKLIMLELQGYIKSLPGNYYVRN